MGDNSPLNDVRGLLGFLRRWDDRTEAGQQLPQQLKRSGVGNINLRGSADCYHSYLLTRWHPSFELVIEPGVRDLVIALVRHWDCVTYTSCEGHPAQGSVPMRPRHVGLVARSSSEYARLDRLLRTLVDLTNGGSDRGSVRLRLLHRVIIADEDLRAPGLDLLFDYTAAGLRTRREDHASRASCEELECLYEKCLSHVAEVGATP